MTKMNLSDCIALAEFAHRNQYDKAGEPYITHPKRVLASVQAQGAQPYVQMAAVLHDVTEDTPFTPQMLAELGVPEAAVQIVKLVDRDASRIAWDSSYSMFEANRDVDYSESGLRHDWLYNAENAADYYYAAIKRNPGAVQVKMADIGDNLQPWRLAYLPPETQDRLRAKYAKAIQLLTG